MIKSIDQEIAKEVPPEKEKALLDMIRGMLDAKEIYYQNPGLLQSNESAKPLCFRYTFMSAIYYLANVFKLIYNDLSYITL